MAHYDVLENGEKILNANNEVVGFEDSMYFDKRKKRFVLKNDSVINELGVNLIHVRGSEENVKRFLEELSNLVYAYVYKKKPAHKRPKLEYALAFDLAFREAIYNSMVDMVRYALYSGGNITGYQPGVNFNESGKLNMDDIRDERIVSYVIDSELKTKHLIDRGFKHRFKLPKIFEWK